MIVRRLLPFLAVLLAPVGAAGQSIPSPYRFIENGRAIGAYVSYLAIDGGEVGVGPRSGVSIGARYAMEVSDPLSVEGSIFYFPTDRAVLNPARDPDDLEIGEADVHIFGFEGGVRFNPVGRRTWNDLAPFVVAKLGIAFDIASDSEVEQILEPADRFDFGTSFLAEIGLGSRWIPSDRWSLRGDVTLFLWQIETPDGFLRSDRSLGPLPEDEWVGGTRFSLGASYRF